jgi:ribosomal protein S18 acetylase RimI-like enzyme
VAEVRIVAAGVEQLDSVEPLWLMLSAHHGDLTPPELPVRPPAAGWTARRERYRQALEDGAILFLAEGPERVVGYAFAHPRGAPESLAIDRLLEVETVAVLAEARGKGVGTALMEAVEGWARERGFEHLALSVRTANEGARRLYERRGFRSLYETMYSTLAPRDCSD